jgi:hypothetical protein
VGNVELWNYWPRLDCSHPTGNDINCDATNSRKYR